METTDAAPPTTAPTTSVSVQNPAAQLPGTVAVEDKTRREAQLLWLIENTPWQDADNFMVEDNVLKQIIGFDPAVFFCGYAPKDLWQAWLCI